MNSYGQRGLLFKNDVCADANVGVDANGNGAGNTNPISVLDDQFDHVNDFAVAINWQSQPPSIENDVTNGALVSGNAPYNIGYSTINFNQIESDTAIGGAPSEFSITDQDYATSSTMSPGLTWLVDGFWVPASVTLTIAPGTVVKAQGGGACQYDGTVCVNGTLDAVGTSSDPITFTSINDNSIGGDALGRAFASGRRLELRSENLMVVRSTSRYVNEGATRGVASTPTDMSPSLQERRVRRCGNVRR